MTGERQGTLSLGTLPKGQRPFGNRTCDAAHRWENHCGGMRASRPAILFRIRFYTSSVTLRVTASPQGEAFLSFVIPPSARSALAEGCRGNHFPCRGLGQSPSVSCSPLVTPGSSGARGSGFQALRGCTSLHGISPWAGSYRGNCRSPWRKRRGFRPQNRR